MSDDIPKRCHKCGQEVLSVLVHHGPTTATFSCLKCGTALGAEHFTGVLRWVEPPPGSAASQVSWTATGTISGTSDADEAGGDR